MRRIDLAFSLLLASLALLVGVLVGRDHAPRPPRCTAEASSVAVGRPAVQTWYPKGCAIYPGRGR